MRTISIRGSIGRSILGIGETLDNLNAYIPDTKTVIITDRNVKRYYGKAFPPYEIVEIGIGEKIKTMDTISEIFGEFVRSGIDRSSFIVGIGGGIVCDIAGFAASTYMRGVRFGFVSSTLLSQVDASVGGKNGVNYKGYKNLVGVFNQPDFVICDMKMLQTLPKQEILCGMAEVVKHGAIADAKLFSYLEEHVEEALSLEEHVIEKLVYESIVIKSEIVNRDEKEKGERKKLNFGHTFGHALEKATGIPHGEAVSVGMVVASRLSAKRGCLSVGKADRIRTLLDALGLPTVIEFDKKEVLDALGKDKKRKGNLIDFVLLEDIGEAIIEEIPITELEGVVMGL